MTEPAHDPAAERAVLGACLLSPTAITDVAPLLRGDDFWDPKHEVLWGAITTLTAQASPADIITVATHLRQAGQIREAGGDLYLHELIADVPATSNAVFYARALRDLSARRRLTAAGQRVQSLAASAGDATTLTAQALTEVESVHRPDPTAGSTLLGDLMDAEIADISSGEPVGGIPWPWTDARAMLNPLSPGQLVLVAARASMGKSVVCVDIAREAAIRRGHTTVLHSLEMSRGEIIRRILAAEARVPLSDLNARTVSEKGWDRIAKAHASLCAAPLHIIDTPDVGLADIRASIKKYGAELVVLDYVQLAAVNPKAERRQGLEEFARGLKLTAKAAGIPIVAAAQLNRGPDARHDHTPQLSDLRETGGLENDADTVVLVYRPDYYDKDSLRAGEVDLIVGKQRNGPTGTVTLVHQLHYARIVDAA